MTAPTPIPIAVIGMGCRLPGGANSPEKLWELLSEGRSGWGPVPADRWNSKSFYHPSPDATEGYNAETGYFLKEDISTFDPGFFGIMPYEADGIDPQQRILLETTYEALENAGQTVEGIHGSDTSVYIAAFARDYDRMGYKDTSHWSKHRMTGTGEAILANRISYVFDLKGASATVDTGCSGSIVALHQACQTLRTGESGMAIAGGTQLVLTPDQTLLMSMVGMTNADGKCYVFDSRGAGYARGEGVGAVILKRLSDAVADGDPIHAIIRGTGLNQDGKTHGIHLPNGKAQASLMRSVYKTAGLDPRETIYVEAHGTGTQAGDKAEIGSINEIFCTDRDSKLLVGSVKSNIGHLEAASGIAGLIKAIMILKNSAVPPNLDFIKPKEGLLLQERNITVPVSLTLLPRQTTHRVSLNSFGYGGTNGHVILESAPAHSTQPRRSQFQISHASTNGDLKIEEEPRLFVLSAKSELSLRATIQKLRDWATVRPLKTSSLASLSYTLSSHRSIFQWRHSLVATEHAGLIEALNPKQARVTRASLVARVVFLFNGQGAQWFAMGRELIASSQIFRKSMTASQNFVASFGCVWDLSEELSRDESLSRINESEISQPACTAIQIALIDLLRSVSIRPQAVLGHSSGEIAAAYACEILSHENAMKIAYYRGFVSGACKNVMSRAGAMLAVGAGESAINTYLSQTRTGLVSIACQNSPESTTVSGDDSAIDELMTILDSHGIWNRKLKVDTAYHSHHMKKVADRYRSDLGDLVVRKHVAGTKFYSSVTGDEKCSDFGTEYWIENLVSKVRFSDAFQALCRTELVEKSRASAGLPANIFIELGPHSTFAGPLRQIFSSMNLEGFQHSYLPTLVRGSNALGTVAKTLGKVFELGYLVDLEKATSLNDSGLGVDTSIVIDNLPGYSWDRSGRYWQESRLSRNHRLRPFPYHDLLGLKIVSSRPQVPVWRNHLSLETLPWLQHHFVDGFVIFPGSGYVCMVIEALKQITEIRGTPGIISRYVIKDVILSKALIIPESAEDSKDLKQAQVEVQLSFTPMKNKGDQFHISSFDADGTWSEHCSGSATVEFVTTVDEVEGEREQDLLHHDQIRRFHDMHEKSKTEISSDDIYKDLSVNGNVFGETFRLLKNVRIGDHQGVATIVIPNIASCMPYQFMQPHVVHPTTLDGVSQLSLPLYKQYCCAGPVMPVSMGEISISANVDNNAGTELFVALDFETKEARSATMTSTVYQKDSSGNLHVVMSVSNAQLRSIGEAKTADENVPFYRKMAYRVEWGPDIEYLDLKPPHLLPTESKEVLLPSKSNPAALLGSPVSEQRNKLETDQRRLLERSTIYYLHTALKKVSREAVEKVHLIKLFDWMTGYISSENAQTILAQATDGIVKDCFYETDQSGVEGRMLCRIGENLSAILLGNIEPLSVMLEDGLLHRFYADTLPISYKQMVDYVKLLAFKNPHMTVLEIGAGTGGATLPLLQGLTQDDQILLDRYHYTDISSGFFEGAKSLLSDWITHIEFRPLDCGRDPLEQGFAENSCDLIIASNVLHATKSMDETLANARKLLKRDGKLLIIELTQITANLSLIFGTLRDWWSFDDDRRGGPTMTESQWNQYLLKGNNFGGLMVSCGDFDGSARRNSVMVSQVKDMTSAMDIPRPKIELLLGNTTELFVGPFIQSIFSLLKERKFQSSEVSWNSLQIDASTVYVIVDSMEQPLLANPSPKTFRQIRELVTTAKQVLWISTRSDSAEYSRPESGLISGLARVARRENEGIIFVTFDIRQSLIHSQPELLRTLADVCSKSFCAAPDRREEVEYAYDSGRLLIPRVKTDVLFNSWLDKVSNNGLVENTLYHQKTRPLKLLVEKPGMLNSLVFVDDALPETALGAEELEIEVKAWGVNFKDVFIAMGQMQPGVRMAGECAGVISAVGSSFHGRYKIGDRVCAADAATPFSSRTRVGGNNAFQLPETMSFAVAASIPVVFLTAYYSLIEVAQLRKGQTILIHAASGGVGQAAIMIAQSIGADIFTTPYLLLETDNVQGGIMRLTQNKGVDVVLNSLSGELLEASWASVALMGTFIEIGKADIYKKNALQMDTFDRHVTFAAVDMTLLFRHRSEDMADRFVTLFRMFEMGILHPVEPVTTMEITNIEEAFRLIQSRRHVGKIVIVADDKTEVNAIPTKPAQLQLHQNASYIVAGGLGDLGIRICSLLAKYGAKNIIAFSRRALDIETQQALKGEVLSLGATLHIVQCDITDSDAVLEIAQDVQKRLPPVRGIIHAGMVLKDHPLEQMTYEDYMTALRPKVHGTRNLDDSFGQPYLDFFIMLSSITGMVGKSGQANYATGNTFQDAFAHDQSRHKAHTRYISLDLGAVAGSNAISSLPLMQQELLSRESVMQMKFEELFKVLEYSMGAQASKDNSVQTVLGIDRQMMEAVQDTATLSNPLFSHLPYMVNDGSPLGKTDDTVDIAQSIKAVQTFDDADALILQEMAKKLARLTGTSIEESNMDSSIADLGLDSLIAIELKNWISRTFLAVMQTAEIFNSASIVKLSRLVASRSTLVPAKLKENATRNEAPLPRSVVTKEVTLIEHLHQSQVDQSCCRSFEKVPKISAPDIELALKLFRESIKHFCSPDEFLDLENALAEFKETGSIAQKLYDRLVDRSRRSDIDNWDFDPYLNHHYLKPRNPLFSHAGNYFAMHNPSKVAHSQAEQAAVIALSAARYKQAAEMSQLEPSLGTPSCMYMQQWLFNSPREPQLGRDRMQQFPGNDYLVVLRRGHVFKVMLIEEGKRISYKKLKATFEAILLDPLVEESWVGILATDQRDAWAKTRAAIADISPQNKAYLHAIEAAAFIICLDDGSPSSITEWANLYYMGNGFNRWNDCGVQFSVASNGVSGTTINHTMIDGLTFHGMNEWITRDIMEYGTALNGVTSNGVSQSADHRISLDRYLCTTTPAIDAHILSARAAYFATTSSREFAYHSVPLFGKELLISKSLSMKGIFDIIIQLAGRLYFGYNQASWEAISHAEIHKGRAEMLQICTPSVVAFCEAALDSEMSALTRRNLLLRAVNDHGAVLKGGSKAGLGFRRIFDAMDEMREDTEELPRVLKNSTYKNHVRQLLAVNFTDDSLLTSVYLLPEPESVWIMYHISDNG
ncbi:Highly reducing polyketide synthase [Hyphodiscus hymeniophilus]|uniref:Highly reducing polyketide synthase n=1 Tax=Hyphodiscus hymeniophilus TaxID=353542 RepID=A0A9P6SKP5_9HELO|nr:Highly reducing polyketide synthase [Hyphodiscus hymeniophilus]